MLNPQTSYKLCKSDKIAGFFNASCRPRLVKLRYNEICSGRTLFIRRFNMKAF
jgi:hypothetical protein